MSFWRRLLDRAGSIAEEQSEPELFDDEFLKKLESLAMTSRKAAAGLSRGDRRAKKKGSGVEFADHRNYAPGDDIRFLDLGVYQRFGKLLLRVFEEEEDLSVYFLVDCSASMARGRPSKYRQAARVSAALAYIALTSLDRVSFVAVGDHMNARMPPTRGKQRIFRVLSFLRGLSLGGPTDLSSALRSFSFSHRRKGLAILVSDLYDPAGFEAGINALRYSKFEVGVLHLSSPEDAALHATGDLNLVDAETGASREVTVTDSLRRQVADGMTSYQEGVARFCKSHGVAYFPVNPSEPFDEAVLAILRQGGLLR